MAIAVAGGLVPRFIARFDAPETVRLESCLS
jgi:hypothetical protein